MFLAMLREESHNLALRLDQIHELTPDDPAASLATWIDHLFAVAFEPVLHAHLAVLDSDEVRAAAGYRRLREQERGARERSLIDILERGRRDGTFPQTIPTSDALAINALVSRILTTLRSDDPTHGRDEKLRVLDFTLRALGAVTVHSAELR